MKKFMENWFDKQFPCREIDLTIIDEDYGKGIVADYELWRAIEDYVEMGDGEGIDLDNSIYYYCDSCMVASDPTDAELIWHVLKGTTLETDITDRQYYLLMRLADYETAIAYEKGATNTNLECYECGGDYSAYCYDKGSGGSQQPLYYGQSARACWLAVAAWLKQWRKQNPNVIAVLQN